jgi:hypothetical protein
MAVFLGTILIFGVVMAAMAVGVIAGRAPIKGSCGGMGAVGVDAACDLCGGNPQRCEEETRVDDRSKDRTKGKSKLFYPAKK